MRRVVAAAGVGAAAGVVAIDLGEPARVLPVRCYSLCLLCWNSRTNEWKGIKSGRQAARISGCLVCHLDIGRLAKILV